MLTGIQASDTRMPPLGAVVAVVGFEGMGEAARGGDGVFMLGNSSSKDGGGDSKSKNMEMESSDSPRSNVSGFVISKPFMMG